MRNLNPAALAAIQQKYATEPINIIEIDWVGGGTRSYADRDVENIPGRILELSPIDSVLDTSRSNTTQSLAFTLDDTDGTIKNILDNHPVNQVPVRVFQYFEGLALADKFLIFAGHLNTPYVWQEATRAIQFNVISQLEDLEFGFSPEEGEIPGLPSDLVGVPWPSIFGTVLNVPAVQVGPALSGTTTCGVGFDPATDTDGLIAQTLGGVGEIFRAFTGQFFNGRLVSRGREFVDDCSFFSQLQIANIQLTHTRQVYGRTLLSAQNAALGTDVWMTEPSVVALQQQIRSQEESIAELIAAKEQKDICDAINARATAENASMGEGCDVMQVLGGEDFPQDQVIRITVGDTITLTGIMRGDEFTIQSRELATQNKVVEEEEETNEVGAVIPDECNPNIPQTQVQEFSFSATAPIFPPRINVQGPSAFGGFLGGFFITITSQETIRAAGEIHCTPASNDNSTTVTNTFVGAGARVTLADDEQISYVASITPGDVLCVKARRQFEGEDRLVDIPSSYYDVLKVDFKAFEATFIVMNCPLSSRPDEGWSDDVFVTYRSDSGPNTVDILKYIIDEYTDLDYDQNSFDEVREFLEPFPSDFAVLERRNTIDLMKDICFQARCGFWVTDGTAFIRYLPKRPDAPDVVIDKDNIELGSILVTTTPAEDVVTKMVIRYQPDYAEEPETIILRNNIPRYGTVEREFNWFIYSNARTAYHAATFWLIRLSNVWQQFQFRGFLDLLPVETFDSAMLNATGFVAPDPVLTVVHEATYDSAQNNINFMLEVPVLAGFQEEHPFYWPFANDDPYPSRFEAPDQPRACGTLPNVRDLTGALGRDRGVTLNGPNTVFGPNSTQGTPTPSDTNFVAGVRIRPEDCDNIEAISPTVVSRTTTVTTSELQFNPPIETFENYRIDFLFDQDGGGGGGGPDFPDDDDDVCLDDNDINCT